MAKKKEQIPKSQDQIEYAHFPAGEFKLPLTKAEGGDTRDGTMITDGTKTYVLNDDVWKSVTSLDDVVWSPEKGWRVSY